MRNKLYFRTDFSEKLKAILYYFKVLLQYLIKYFLIN